MTGPQTLVARAALGAAATAAGLLAVNNTRLQRLPQQAFDRLALAAYLLTRLGLYVLIFFGLHLAPRGDVPGFYLPEATAALHGLLPYRDFPSSYAPLHSYLDAAVLRLWHSPLAIILLAIAAEALLLPIWLPLARRLFPEPTTRRAAILYITSPISLQFVAIDGQDNVLIAVLLALATAALLQRRALTSAVTLALGIVTIKFLPLIYTPLFALASHRRFRWPLGLLATLTAVYTALALAHLPPHLTLLAPLLREAGERTASNLPYLFTATTGLALPPLLEDALLLLALAAVLARFAQLGAPPSRALATGGVSWESRMPALLVQLTFGSVALTLTLLLVSKKSWPPYLMLVLFPLCLLIAQQPTRLRLALFSGFSFLAVVAHSFWATVFSQALAPELHTQLITHPATPLLFLLLQLLLIAGYLWLLRTTLTHTKPAR